MPCWTQKLLKMERNMLRRGKGKPPLRNLKVSGLGERRVEDKENNFFRHEFRFAWSLG